MVAFEGEVEGLLAAGDFDAVLKQVDEFLEKYDPQGEDRQHIVMGRVMVFVEQGEKEKAFAEIDKMATFAPESEFSQNVAQIKGSITEHLENRVKMEAEAEAAAAAEPEQPSVVEEAEAAEKMDKEAQNPAAVVE